MQTHDTLYVFALHNIKCTVNNPRSCSTSFWSQLYPYGIHHILFNGSLSSALRRQKLELMGLVLHLTIRYYLVPKAILPQSRWSNG